MFNQLVESNDHTKETKRRGGFLLTTFFVVCTIFSSGILWSLFAKDVRMNAGSLELSALVAPLPIVEAEPLPPREVQPKKAEQSAPNADRRTEIIQDITESPQNAPDKISNQKSNVPPRNPNNRTVLSSDNFNAENSAPSDYEGTINTKGDGLKSGGVPDGVENGKGETVPPPPPFVKPESKPKEEIKKPAVNKVSLGVINGKASNLVKPPYPPAAKAVRASGAVNVQVTIDEKGNVTSANAVSGHPLLRPAAETAARASKFNPTLLSREPVKVSGVIIYNFAAQ